MFVDGHLGLGLSNAVELDTSDALDKQLTQSIPAHSSVSGWATWYCEGQNACGESAKLTVTEAKGSVSETNEFPFSS